MFGANGCFIDVGPAHALGQSPQNVVLLQHLRRSERSALEITGKIKYSEERLFHHGPAFAAFYRVPEKLADLFHINAVIIPRQRKQTFDMKKIFILHFLQQRIVELRLRLAETERAAAVVPLFYFYRQQNKRSIPDCPAGNLCPPQYSGSQI